MRRGKIKHLATRYRDVFPGRLFGVLPHRWLARTGQVLSRRTLNKIVREEQGQAYATRQILAAGTPPREPLEPPKAWLGRVLPLIATRIRHPGNHVFAFGLDDLARAQVRAANAGGQPYPKRVARAA